MKLLRWAVAILGIFFLLLAYSVMKSKGVFVEFGALGAGVIGAAMAGAGVKLFQWAKSGGVRSEVKKKQVVYFKDINKQGLTFNDINECYAKAQEEVFRGAIDSELWAEALSKDAYISLRVAQLLSEKAAHLK